MQASRSVVQCTVHWRRFNVLHRQALGLNRRHRHIAACATQGLPRRLTVLPARPISRAWTFVDRRMPYCTVQLRVDYNKENQDSSSNDSHRTVTERLIDAGVFSARDVSLHENANKLIRAGVLVFTVLYCTVHGNQLDVISLADLENLIQCGQGVKSALASTMHKRRACTSVCAAALDENAKTYAVHYGLAFLRPCTRSDAGSWKPETTRRAGTGHASLRTEERDDHFENLL